MIYLNTPEYKEIIKERSRQRFYGDDYKDILWAEDAFARLERKMPYADYTEQDYIDFYKIKDIYARIFDLKLKPKPKENEVEHISTHYIWRTRGDANVRHSHAQNDGLVFAWNKPPATGHPGSDFGCRCWAEPIVEKLEEKVIQTVTYAAEDQLPSWTKKDFLYHYHYKNGVGVTLPQIGHLNNVIQHAKTYNQIRQNGGGTIFERVVKDVIKNARKNGEGVFRYTFNNSYEFQPIIFSLGSSTIRGSGYGRVIDKGRFWLVLIKVNYVFIDSFKRPYDIYDTGIWPLTLETGIPYSVTGNWTTSIEALIRK